MIWWLAAFAAPIAWLAFSATRWRLAHDTGVHRYYDHVDGRWRAVKVGRGHQPVNRRRGLADHGPARIRLATHRATSKRPEPRFSLLVDGELLEADSFGGIIQMMRERGHSNDDVLAAALVIHREPRGAELRLT